MKRLFALLTVMLWFHLLDSQNSFSAQLNIPEEVIQGESCEFELEIYKPENIRGYAVFSQKFPAGFYVKEIESSEAEFSYENNLLTITWLRIQTDPKVTVLYEVSPMYGITGDFKFSGNLTYMINGNQGIFDLKECTLKVISEKIKTVTNTSSEENSVVLLQKNNLPQDLSCKREQIFNSKKNEYVIEVTIKKEGGGSYNLVEQLPKGFSFFEFSNGGANVSRGKDKVSFLWKSIPDTKEIRVKYTLIPENSNIGDPKIYGKLSVLRNGELINVPVMN